MILINVTVLNVMYGTVFILYEEFGLDYLQKYEHGILWWYKNVCIIYLNIF